MPQLIVQPGLGDSLNRYLERLGRRGEEQRRLKQQRDLVQAEMDQRASELRTRIISESISQGVGLFTDEMQRDRASQRAITEGGIASERRMVEGDVASERRINERDLGLARELAEPRGQLTGQPAIDKMYLGMGMVTSHNSLYSGTMKTYGLGKLLLGARRGIQNHENELTTRQKDNMRDIDQRIVGWETYLSNGTKVKVAPFVEGMTAEIQALVDITPAGPPKPKAPAPTLGTGSKSENNPEGNNLPLGMSYEWDPKKQTYVLLDGELERVNRNDELWKRALSDTSPRYDRWEMMDEKEQERLIKDNPPEGEEGHKTYPPNKVMNVAEAEGWVLQQMEYRKRTLSADGGHARPEDVLLDQQAFAALAEEADQPDPQKLTSAIQSLPDKELDALVKKAGGPIMLKDEQGLPMIVPNDDGQDSYVWYLGGGKVRLVTIAGMGGPGGPARPTTSGTPPNAGSGVDSLIRP